MDIQDGETQEPAAKAGSENLSDVITGRWPYGWRSSDPTLGDSIFYGPSLLELLSYFGLAILMIGIGLLAPLAVGWIIPVGVGFGLAGIWAAQTGLKVGTRGFRTSGPLGSNEVGWGHVSKVRSRFSYWVRARRIDVSLDDGQVMELGYIGFSDSHDAISDVMEDCLAAWRRAHPWEAMKEPEGFSLPPAPIAVSRGRKPVAFGLSAAILIAVVCLASAWRLGAFDAIGRGTPAAPQAGHWSGSNPALSFDIGADGQMSNVSLDIEDLPYAWCATQAAAISVGSDYTFSSVLAQEPDNLLTFRVELKGTFYGTTASGTYRTLTCGGAVAGRGSEGRWSAQWVGA